MPFFNFNKRKSPVKKQGINNVGNSCYINSTLQLLFQTTLLDSVKTPNSKIVQELKKLKQCYDQNEKIKVDNFLTQLYIQHTDFKKYQQGDSHELLCCLIEDIFDDFNYVDGKKITQRQQEVDENQLIKLHLNYQENQMLNQQQIIKYREEYVKQNIENLNQVHILNQDIVDQVKTLEKQQIQCQYCNFESINITQSSNITLELPTINNDNRDEPTEEKPSILKLFLVIPQIEKKKSAIFSTTINDFQDINSNYLNYTLNEMIEIVQSRSLGEFEKNDKINFDEFSINYYSLEFNSINFKEIIEYINNFQNGFYVEKQNNKNKQEQKVQQTPVSHDTPAQPEVPQKENIESEQSFEEAQEEESSNDEAVLKLKVDQSILDGLIKQNVKSFKSEHVIFVTVQKNKYEKYLTKNAKAAISGDEQLYNQQFVSFYLNDEKINQTVSLFLKTINGKVFATLDTNQKTTYFNNILLPHFMAFIKDDKLNNLMSKKLELKFKFQIDQDGFIQQHVQIKSKDIETYQSTDAIKKASGIYPQLVLNKSQHCIINKLMFLDQILKYNELQQQELEDWKCKICGGVNKKAIKTNVIIKTSKYLIINFKRFIQSIDSKYRINVVKDNRPVDFPKQLNYQNNSYQLKSIILHYGRLQGGHYINISYIENKFIEFDDDSVQQIDLEDSKCYAQILLYELIEKEE